MAVDAIKAIHDLPVAVGFGVKNAGQRRRDRKARRRCGGRLRDCRSLEALARQGRQGDRATVSAVADLVADLAEGVPPAQPHRAELPTIQRHAGDSMNWIIQRRPRQRSALCCKPGRRQKISGSNALSAARLVFHKDLEANLFVVPGSGYHMRSRPQSETRDLFDDATYEEIATPEVPWTL